MNGRNRHTQYRRGVYRRQRIRTVIITVAIIVVIIAAVFLIVGNILWDKSQERDIDNGVSDETSEVSEPAPHASVRSVKARPVLLETSDSSTFITRLDAALSAGANAASIPLNTESGALLYRSPTAISLSRQLDEEYSVTVKSAVERIENADVYLSGAYYITAMKIEDDLIRSVRLSEDAAILAEAMRAGLDEVMLIVPDMTSAHCDEIVRFIEDIRALCPNVSIGLTLPEAILSSPDNAELIDKLYSGADLLAVNATEYGEAEPEAYIEDTVYDPNIQYYLRRYEMRVLIPYSDDSTSQNSFISALEGTGISNWQILR